MQLSEAMDFLRIDGEENERILEAILEAVPPYIETATGLNADQQDNEPMAVQAGKLLLALWYNAEQTDSQKLERTIESLLKAIKAKYAYS